MSTDPPLLELAIVEGKTKWLKEYLTKHLLSLNLPSTDYQTWFDHFIQTLESRGLSQPSQQKNYLTNVRNAIKVLDPDHPALEIIGFSRETWVEINEADRDRIAERTTKLISNPDAIVAKAIELVKTNNWSEIAAGLAVLTGRRCGEIIKTAQFEYKTKYSVIFKGALKRRSEAVELVFEIPVLCRADLVIEAIANLRLQLGDEVKSLSINQVNQRYEERVVQKCERHFTKLIPPRDGKDNLYSHLFRAVYATIACFWYCPLTVPEMEYRAAIQGHYKLLNEQDDRLRRSLAASRHYFDYKIADANGNLEGRLGIKLSLPGVEVIKQFQQHGRQEQKSRSPIPRKTNINKAKSTAQTESFSKRQLTTMNQPNPLDEAVVSLQLSLSRLENFSQLLELPQSQAIASLVDWAEAGASLAKHFSLEDPSPQVLTSHILELEQSYAAISSNPQPQLSNSTIKGQTGFISIEDHHRLILSVSSLSNSVEFLTKALIEGKSNQIASNLPPSKSRSNVSSSVSATSQATANEESLAPKSITSTNENKTKNRRSVPETRERDTSEVTIEDINSAIDAIIEFNNKSNRPHKQKFRLSIKPVSDLTGRAYNSITKVFKERREEIDAHHEHHKIGKYHNKSRKDEQGNFYLPIESEPEIEYRQLTEVT